MEQTINIPEGARRQHRIIGMFALIQCWEENLDGVVITRDDIKRLIGLRRNIQRARVDWLKEDLAKFFKGSLKNYGDGSRKQFEGIVVSRRCRGETEKSPARLACRIRRAFRFASAPRFSGGVVVQGYRNAGPRPAPG